MLKTPDPITFSHFYASYLVIQFQMTLMGPIENKSQLLCWYMSSLSPLITLCFARTFAAHLQQDILSQCQGLFGLALRTYCVEYVLYYYAMRHLRVLSKDNKLSLPIFSLTYITYFRFHCFYVRKRSYCYADLTRLFPTEYLFVLYYSLITQPTV